MNRLPLGRGKWLCVVSGFILTLAGGINAAPPTWWSNGSPPVINLAAEENNHGVANIGQAKWMAKNALNAIRGVHPATADAIEVELVGSGKPLASWDPPVTQDQKDAQHSPLLVGQLKAIAAPFYSQLHGLDSAWLDSQLTQNQTKDTSDAANFYPWSSSTNDDNNKAPVSIGQLKAVFSLRLESLVIEPPLVNTDQDEDGLPDSWELLHGLDPTDNGSIDPNNGPDGDPDGDGVPNSSELEEDTAPDDASDFPPQVVSISKGASGRSNSVPYPPDLGIGSYITHLQSGAYWLDEGSPLSSTRDSAATPSYLLSILEGITFPGTPPVPPQNRPWFVPQIPLTFSTSAFSHSHVEMPVVGSGIHTSLGATRVWVKAPAASTVQTFSFLKIKEVATTIYPTWVRTSVFSCEAVKLDIPANQTLSNPVDLKPLPTIFEGGYVDVHETLEPIWFKIIHTEIDPATGQTVNPGVNTMLRDEIVDIHIRVPSVGTTDWTIDLSVEPESMRTQSLPNRGNVQMYDFGQIEPNGTVTPDKTQFVLKASDYGERTIRAVFNKEGTLKIKMKSTDGKIDFTSPEYTIQKRIRKYANLPSSFNHDLNQHDQAFINAAAHWGGFYQHQIDDVERLKAIGMAESELGLTDATDIMTVGNPGDHVLDTFRNVPPYDRFPGVYPLGGLALREVDIANNTTKMLSYPAANETPATTAIRWGVCWLYQKASSIQNNPNPPQPPNPPNPYIPGPWRSWDNATERYNGGGVSNYLERINRSMKEGRHPSNANLYIWPLKSNKKARGNQ